MSLKNYSKEELEKEIIRREEQKNKPFPLTDLESCWSLDYSKVKKACERHIQNLADEGQSRDDEHWIYEAAKFCIEVMEQKQNFCKKILPDFLSKEETLI